MDKKPTWWQILKIKFMLGQTFAPVRNLGKCDEVWIRYEDMYISLLISAEGETKGEIASMGWQHELPPRIPLREVRELK